MFSLKCDKLTDAVFVGFRGKEQISRPYEYEVFFTVPSGTSVRAAVGERATIRAARGDLDNPFVIHGVLANVRLLHQSGERALYGGLLVPRLWLLRHFWRSYVFTGKTLKQFVTDTLKDGGLAESDFRFSIDDDAHAEEEFVTQYRESHLDFLHRWLEREGVYYFFEHDPDAESEVMVLVEDKSATVPFPGSGRVRYIPVTGDEASGVEAFHHLESHVSWLPRSVTIADYDYANPAVSLKSDSDVTSKGIGAIREYGYRAFVEGDLRRLAMVKAQAIGCRETTLTAAGNVIGPRAGYRLAIDHQPEDLEEEWLAVEVQVSGSAAGWTEEVARLTGLGRKVMETKVFAVPSSVQYRAPQTTPWPRIYGLENGVVSGEADSPYAQIDDDGRYLVRFEFDTSDLPDAKVSTRVRMLQPHGGSTEGMHFPLRKGTEVMIAFLGGDPDRPFIAGVVPNAHKPSVVGSRNNTQNIIRTGANNQIVMEDEQGKEFIFMHTPNQSTGIYMGSPAGRHSSVYTGEGDAPETQLFTSPACADPSAPEAYEGSDVSLYPHTDGNAGSFIGGDSWQEVGGAENIFVKGAVAHGYRATYALKVGGAATENYYATRTTTVKSGRDDTVEAGGWVQNITPHLHQTVHGSGFQHVDGGGWRHEVSGEAHDKYGSWKTEVKGGWNQEVGGAWSGKFAKGSVTFDANPSDLKIHSDGQIAMDAPTLIHIKAATVDCESTGLWSFHTNFKNETFLQAGSAGVLKMDETGIAQAITGLKFETTGVAFERAGLVPKEYALTREAAGAALKNAGAKIKSTAADIWNGAFKKT